MEENCNGILNMEKPLLTKVEKNFDYFCACGFIYGIFYTFCLFKNSVGITYPLYVLGNYFVAILFFKKLEIEIKKNSHYYIILSVLLAISIFTTANIYIQLMDKVGIFLLFCIFLLHQLYDDERWKFGKYLKSIVIFLLYVIGCIGYPFTHAYKFLQKSSDEKYKKILYIAVGLIVAIPVCFIIIIMLSTADVVFEQIIDKIINGIFMPSSLPLMLLMTIFGFLFMYCFVCSACLQNIKKVGNQKKVGEPIIAITLTGLLGLIYLLFSMVQILYLFLGAGELPDGITYSQYARQGFFQLLAVAVFNLVLVLFCFYYFKDNKILKGILMIISVCTFLMIVSAFYRMILYVKEYDLTFLRLFVLWFLALLTLLMMGIVWMIYHEEFHLFRYCLIVVSISYLLFAYARPDRIIAEYNITHNETITTYDLSYFLYSLSEDAIPVITELPLDRGQQETLDFYMIKNIKKWEGYTFRRFNYSYYRAAKVTSRSIK